MDDPGNTLPWCGTVLVDGQAYTWMGIPSNCAPNGIQAIQRSMSFTTSKTTFVLRAGTVDVSEISTLSRQRQRIYAFITPCHE